MTIPTIIQKLSQLQRFNGTQPDNAVYPDNNDLFRDVMELCRAWLDPRAIDEEWCRSLLGKANVGRLYQGGQWIPEIRGIDQWVRLKPDTTRGELVRLLHSIGWEKS